MIMIGGGDLVIPWQKSELYWRTEYLQRPTFLFGVGVPAWGGHRADVVQATSDFMQHPNVRRVVARDGTTGRTGAADLETARHFDFPDDRDTPHQPPDRPAQRNSALGQTTPSLKIAPPRRRSGPERIRPRLLQQQRALVADELELDIHGKPRVLQLGVEQRTEVVVDGA